MNYSTLKKILNKNGFKPSKALGQNFLIDDNVLDKVVGASGVDDKTGALEIGPGVGALTHALAKRCKSVVSVELDRKLAQYLEEEFAQCENVKIISANALKTDLNKLIGENLPDMPVSIVANLPYYITTPLIMKFFEDALAVSSVTVMIQKEVADRIIALPATPDYGALSVACQYHSAPSIAAIVPPGAFYPPPKVTSAIVHFDIQNHTKPAVLDEKIFFKVVRAAFGQRRKTLANALCAAFDIPKDEIKNLILKVYDNENIRGENLGLAEFILLADLITANFPTQGL